MFLFWALMRSRFLKSIFTVFFFKENKEENKIPIEATIILIMMMISQNKQKPNSEQGTHLYARGLFSSSPYS